MAKPFTRAQALENAAFLRALRRLGNARGAARAIGKAYGTMQHRRTVHPAFATHWDAALAFADARLSAKGGRHRPRAVQEGGARTVGGEPVVVRLKSGRLQMRSAQPGKLTRACEQAFFAALSATANVALSAAAAGASEAAFYRRRRTNPAFAREMRLALQMGYDRLEGAMLASWNAQSHDDDAWRHNEPPPIPPMSPSEALQLMYLHQKEARLWAERPDFKKKRGESSDQWSIRMQVRAAAERSWEREGRELELAWLYGDGDRASPHEEAPKLPALDQVTGWSKAKGRAPHRDGVALFGGWRMKDMKAKR